MDAENVVPAIETPTPVVETPKDITFDAPPVDEETTQKQETEGQDAETTEESTDQTERDEKGRFKGVQPRIDELTKARREAEREAAYWKQVAQGQAQPSAEAANPKPTPDQFSDYAEFVEALTDWKADQAVAKRMEQDSNRKVAETRTQTFVEREVAARIEMPDYTEVVGGSDAPLADHVGEVILESEHGPKLAYHLAKNPDVLDRLNRMSPLAAARELGRIEAGFSSKPEVAAPAPVVKKISQTPAPANTSATQGRSTTPPLGESSMEEYMAQRKAQGARWAR